MENLKLLLFTVILFVAGCQSDANKAPKTDSTKPTTFANFYVRYLQSDQKANAEARFKSGMSEEKATYLKIENGVFFHNGNMEEAEIKNYGTRYNYDFEGSFSDGFAFRFTDPLRGKMEHVVNIPTINNYSFGKEISKKKGLRLTWEGDPLTEKETIIVLLNANNKLSSFKVQGPTTGTSVDISNKKLGGIPTGKATVYLVRKKLEEVTSPNFLAINDLEFYTQEMEIVISE